jgi:hypothetical protein
MIGEEIMKILTSNGKKLINYNNVECLMMYETDNGMWRIQAICTSGEYDAITQPCSEQECQNEFDRLCDKIARCREHDIIDMGDLWD